MSYRARLRPAKRVAATVVEKAWTLAFNMLSQAAPRTPTRGEAAESSAVLVVAPHPDDEAMGCAGTIIQHGNGGGRVWVAIATDGRRSRAIPDPEKMAVQRRIEALNAAAAMRVSRLAWLGFHEGEWQVSDLKDQLRGLLDELEPQIVYAPSRIDFHPEHFKVAHALALALGECRYPARKSCRVRLYQIQVPLTASLANLTVDVSAVLRDCEAALRCYATQAGSVNCAYRLRRYAAARHRAAAAAEVFWEMPTSAYIALHGAGLEHWPGAFRGLRHFPLTDPLAFLSGGRERRRLHGIVAAASDSA